MTDWRRTVQCEGKSGFESYVLADRIAKRMREAGLGVYRCRWCGNYHVGGERKPGKKRDTGRRFRWWRPRRG